jgi:hypothetical protein
MTPTKRVAVTHNKAVKSDPGGLSRFLPAQESSHPTAAAHRRR